MRLSIREAHRPALGSAVYATACQFPRIDRKKGHSKDLEEVKEYLRDHPGASSFDVALELHLSGDAVWRLMKEATCRPMRS